MQPYYEHAGITIYHGDCRDVLSGFSDVDLIFSDPPYGTGGWRRDRSGNGHDPSASLIVESWDDGAVDWLGLLPPSVRACAAFWPAARTRRLLVAADAAGLTKHRTLYMRKRDPKPMPAGRIRWSVEPIWVLSRDGYVLLGGDDVYETTTPRLGRDSEAVDHPYQKPLDVVLWALGKLDGALICDPFLGSGTTLAAAKLLGRRAIGIEIEERYCEIAARRLSQEVMELHDV